MENHLAVVARNSKSRDELHAHFFQHFRTLFRTRPEADVRSTVIQSHNFPDALFQDRQKMGDAISGVLLAMLDHELPLGGDAPFVVLTQEHFNILDEILLKQAAITGLDLLASDLALSRVREWTHRDLPKVKRWHKGIDKYARIQQRKTATPITDPYLREVKQQAVEQLRPMWARLGQRFAKQRGLPTPEHVKAAFEQEASSPDAPEFITHPHNYQWWLRWLDFHRKDLVKMISGSRSLSVERLFDSYAAFVSSHSNSEYTRKQISLMK